MRVNGVRDIVGIRKGTHRGVRKRGLASLAVLGVAVIAGLLAAWGVSPVETWTIPSLPASAMDSKCFARTDEQTAQLNSQSSYSSAP